MTADEHVPDALARLADRLGVTTSYVGWTGQPVHASVESTLAVVRALGVDVERPEDAARVLAAITLADETTIAPPVVIAWADALPGQEEASLPLWVPAETDGEVELSLTLETGESTTTTHRLFELRGTDHAERSGIVRCVRHVPLPTGGALGYHHARWRLGDKRGETFIIAAPRRAFTGDGVRRWGVFAPTYALRSPDSGAAGDLAELEKLAALVTRHRGRFIGTLPLLAAFLDEPCEASPYSPASRLAWNELYLDLRRAPGWDASPRAQALWAASETERHRLHAEPWIDYRAQYRWRRPIIDELARVAWSSDALRPALDAFAARPHVLGYAVFRAIGEREHAAWSRWPAQAVALARSVAHSAPPAGSLDIPVGVDADTVRSHIYAQWATEGQLADVSARSGAALYLDLPVGVGCDAYDVLAFSDQFVTAASTGAPPDALFLGGQDWGLPPLHPERARATGWRYVIDVIRNHMRHAGILRIDHVMGLHRLYWVPAGRPATDGVYVRYAAGELWAILCLESHRHRCELVGEDLGVVPPEVPDAMARHGARGLSVRLFSLPGHAGQVPAVSPVDCVASVGTHDTPTFAAYWGGDDLGVMRELGLIDDAAVTEGLRGRAAQRRATISELAQGGFLDAAGARAASEDVQADVDPTLAPAVCAAAMRGIYRQLAASPARDVLVTLEDLWLEPAPQNVPGTGPERPNWRRPCARSVESIAADPVLDGLLDELAVARRADPLR